MIATVNVQGLAQPSLFIPQLIIGLVDEPSPTRVAKIDHLVILHVYVIFDDSEFSDDFTEGG